VDSGNLILSERHSTLYCGKRPWSACLRNVIVQKHFYYRPVEPTPIPWPEGVVEVQRDVRPRYGRVRSPDHFLPMADTDTTILHRPREGDTPAADQPPTKRQKLDEGRTQNPSEVVKAPLLPPSHVLLGITKNVEPDGDGFTQMLETDVGISEYVGRNIPPIQAVIKQRCARYFYDLFTEPTPCVSGSRIFWSSRSTKTTEQFV